jgi:hypothetical protein
MKNKSVCDEMTLQWFGDPQFEEPEDESDFEFVNESDIAEPDPDEGLPDDVKKLSKAELYRQMQEVQKQADSVSALKEGLEGLSTKLQRQGQPVNAQQVPQQQAGESDEEFWKRVSADIWSENPGGVIRDAVQRELSKVTQNIGSSLVENRKMMLRNDSDKGEYYKRYEDEINQVIGSVTPDVRTNPQVVDYAYQEVMRRHSDDIVEEKASKKVDELVQDRVKAELAKYGIDPETGPTKKQNRGTRGMGLESSSGQPAQRSTKPRVVITDDIRRRAAIKGLPPEKLAEVEMRRNK